MADGIDNALAALALVWLHCCLQRNEIAFMTKRKDNDNSLCIVFLSTKGGGWRVPGIDKHALLIKQAKQALQPLTVATLTWPTVRQDSGSQQHT